MPSWVYLLGRLVLESSPSGGQAWRKPWLLPNMANDHVGKAIVVWFFDQVKTPIVLMPSERCPFVPFQSKLVVLLKAFLGIST